MEVTIKKLGTSSNGNWILLTSTQALTLGNVQMSAFVTVDDHSHLTEGQQLMLPKKEYDMIHWSL